MPQPLDLTTLSEAEKDALIGALLARIDALTARVAALEAENKELREKLDQPPKTPDNSSLAPSRGNKANRAGTARPKAKPHAGSHRALHPAHCIRSRRADATCWPSGATTAKPMSGASCRPWSTPTTGSIFPRSSP